MGVRIPPLAKEKKLKIKDCYFNEIYGGQFYFYSGNYNNFEEKIFKKFGVEKTNDATRGRYLELQNKKHKDVYSYILYAKNKNDYSTIAHEASHIAIAIFNRIGCNINYHTTEPFAYLISWIVETAIEDFKKYRSKL